MICTAFYSDIVYATAAARDASCFGCGVSSAGYCTKFQKKASVRRSKWFQTHTHRLQELPWSGSSSFQPRGHRRRATQPLGTRPVLLLCCVDITTGSSVMAQPRSLADGLGNSGAGTSCATRSSPIQHWGPVEIE